MTKDHLGKVLWEAATPLGFRVRVTDSYWHTIISVKHPVMFGRELSVQAALVAPDEIRRSRTDPDVYLFYKKESSDRWVCAVAKRLNREGFLITTYPTDTIKEGERVWPR
jgi:hypothetical protein